MKEAIQKAIEGGWDKSMPFSIDDILMYTVISQPSFWQALGKAEGWKEAGEYPQIYLFGFAIKVIAEWEYRWHFFIHHLIEGKDIDSFFTNLLKK